MCVKFLFLSYFFIFFLYKKLELWCWLLKNNYVFLVILSFLCFCKYVLKGVILVFGLIIIIGIFCFIGNLKFGFFFK